MTDTGPSPADRTQAGGAATAPRARTADLLQAFEPLRAPLRASPPAAGPRVRMAVVAVAALGDVLLRHGPATVATAILAAAVVLALVWAGLLRSRAAVGLALAGAGFAVLSAVRVSPWLVPLNLIACLGLITLACSYAGGGRLDDVGATTVVQRLVRLARSTLLGVPWVLRGDRVGRRTPRRRPAAAHAGGVLRGLVLAIPLIVVLGLLLTSADVVFAQVFSPDVDPAPLAGHAALVMVSAVMMATWCVDAAVGPVPETAPPRGLLGATECATVLACLVALFGVFGISQVVAASGGAAHVLAEAGLTRAEYARGGFFQLLWVAAITLATLGFLRTVTRIESDRQRKVLRQLTQAAIVLTVLIVGVALRRLDLYVDAFGLTMLRLYSMLFAAWIGVVFVALAAAVRGVGAGRRWVLPGSALVGLLLLAGLNVVNVEAVVARSQLSGRGAAVPLDPAYLAHELSADAVPTLLADHGLGAAQRRQLTEDVCATFAAEPQRRSTLGRNLAHHRAAAALAAACPRP